MRSTTCKGSNGQYREEYHSEVAARIGAERAKNEFGHDLTPQVCRACGYWHLIPVSTSKLCHFCTDSSLFQKDLYSTKQEAEALANRMLKEKRIRLYPYKCPHTSGWHLTKVDPGKRGGKKT